MKTCRDSLVPRPLPSFCRLQYKKDFSGRGGGEPGNEASVGVGLGFVFPGGNWVYMQ